MNEKYNYLLLLLSEKLQQQENEISIYKWQISELEKKLKELEL